MVNSAKLGGTQKGALLRSSAHSTQAARIYHEFPESAGLVHHILRMLDQLWATSLTITVHATWCGKVALMAMVIDHFLWSAERGLED